MAGTGRNVRPTTNGEPRVSHLERSEPGGSGVSPVTFMFGVGVISTAVVAVAVTLLMIFAALSPEISLDVPGVGRCRGSECFSGGGGD